MHKLIGMLSLVERVRAIPPRVRAAVIERDGMVCQHCGCSVARATPGVWLPTDLHLDHVTLFSHGGPHAVGNLVVSCRMCNLARPRPRRRGPPVNPWDHIVTHTARGYWWVPGHRPARLLDGEVSWALESLVSPRLPLMRLLEQIEAGQIAATGPGEPIHAVLA